MRFAGLALFVAIALITRAAAAQSLDYETYKQTVEPIFIKKRAGHARCVACHSASNNAFRLQPLPEDGAWTDEQSRLNYESVKRLVNPREPRGEPAPDASAGT